MTHKMSSQKSRKATVSAQPTPAIPACHWDRLPSELKAIILDGVTETKDRASLCITTKELRQIMTPVLYKKPVINFCVRTADRVRQLQNMLSVSNPGVQCIRIIDWTLPRAHAAEGSKEWPVLSQLVREMLYMHLKQHSLRRLR